MANHLFTSKSFLSSTATLLIFFSALSATEEKSSYRLPGLSGTFSKKVFYIFKQLQDTATRMKTGTPVPPGFKNRLLLYGTPGNGKTTIASTLAEKSGCHFIYVNGPDIVNKYVGQGAENIKKLFEEATECAVLYQQPVIVAIDEIDIFTENTSGEHRTEHKATCEALWLQLDNIQSDRRIFFIGMTNSTELNSTLRTRFGNNIEEIGAPNEETRREALQQYKMYYTGSPWDKEILESLIKKTTDKKISIRFLQDYVQEVCVSSNNEHGGVITSEYALSLLEEMKAKYIESFWKQAYNTACSVTESVNQKVPIISTALMLLSKSGDSKKSGGSKQSSENSK